MPDRRWLFGRREFYLSDPKGLPKYKADVILRALDPVWWLRWW